MSPLRMGPGNGIERSGEEASASQGPFRGGERAGSAARRDRPFRGVRARLRRGGDDRGEREPQRAPFLVIAGEELLRDSPAAGDVDLEGVYEPARLLHPEVEVGAGGPAGRPDVPDDVALRDPGAAPDPRPDFPEMAIVRGEPLRVPQDHEVAVGPLVSGELDGPVPQGGHRGSPG